MSNIGGGIKMFHCHVKHRRGEKERRDEEGKGLIKASCFCMDLM